LQSEFRSEPRSRLPVAAAITIGVLLAAWWWFSGPEEPPPPSAEVLAERKLADLSSQTQRPASPFAAGAAASEPEPSAAEAAASAAALAAIGTVPKGMSAEQWRDLQLALKDHPDRDAELKRVAQYLAYKDLFERFQAAREQHAGTPALKALAQQLDDGLNARLANAEMTAAEATAIKTTLLDQLEPDAKRRAQRLDQWMRQQAQQGVATVNARDAQREAQYKREEAEILAAWRDLPAAQRDPQQLEVQLDALRRRIFTP
jgi:hypothetical protein